MMSPTATKERQRPLTGAGRCDTFGTAGGPMAIPFAPPLVSAAPAKLTAFACKKLPGFHRQHLQSTHISGNDLLRHPASVPWGNVCTYQAELNPPVSGSNGQVVIVHASRQEK